MTPIIDDCFSRRGKPKPGTGLLFGQLDRFGGFEGLQLALRAGPVRIDSDGV